MTKMKLVLASTVAAALAFGVAACGPQAETPPEEAAPAAVTEPAPPADPAAVPPTDPAAVPPATDPAAAPAPAPAPEKK
jgi:hypothetical protein